MPLTANANGMTCLLARCKAMSSKGDGVIYAIAVVGSCAGEAKT